MKINKILILMFLFLIMISHVFGDELSIITNKGNDTISLTINECRKIFTGKKRTWQNGDRIMVALLKKGTLHTQFLKEVARQNATQFSIAWKKLIFTGRAPLLKYLKTEKEIIEYVKNNKNAIGYINKSNGTEEIKTLFIRE